MNEKDSSTALTTKTTDWPGVITSVVNQRHLKCVQQTPNSAKKLFKSVGCFGDGKALSHDVETFLFEAFIENDFDGKLHLTTIHQDDMTPIGLVFWREIPEEEMKAWIDYEKLCDLARRKRKQLRSDADSTDNENVVSTRACDEILREQTGVSPTEQALTTARNESLTALAQCQDLATNKQLLLPNSVAQAWVKIELLAVRLPWWGQRIGTLSLACAMSEAWKCNNSRVVLHIAGGLENVPAVRIYERFGFVPAPGIFHKPDKDIYVLGNIGQALQSLLWSEALQVSPDYNDIIMK